MFVPAPELKRVATPKERVVAIIESINANNVAIPGTDTEPTQAYIVGVRNPDNSFSVLIYLHQIVSNRPAIYVCEPRSIPLTNYPEVEANAIEFVESMGFMVDNVNFRRLGPQQQEKVLERVPAFHEDLSRFAKDSGSQDGDDADEEIAVIQGVETEALDELEILEPIGFVDEELPIARGKPAQTIELTEEARTAAIEMSSSLQEEDKQKLLRLLAAF